MLPSVRRVAEYVAVVAIIGLIAWGALSMYRPVRVIGSSMNPVLVAGDLVLVDRRDPVQRGDIALFQTAGHGPVLHRVLRVGKQGSVRTKGDANPIADRDPVPASAVVGPVRAIIPVGRLITRWRGR